MPQCPTFPQGKLKEMIEETVQTGNEHGFVRCADGSTSEILEGGSSGMDIGPAVEECDLDNGPVDIVHTHPNGVERLSKQDREVAADENIENVCVAVEGGDIRCEKVTTCETEVSD